MLWSESAAVIVFRTSMRLPGIDYIHWMVQGPDKLPILAHKEQELVKDV